MNACVLWLARRFCGSGGWQLITSSTGVSCILSPASTLMATGVRIVFGESTMTLLRRSDDFRGVDFADTAVQHYARALRAAIREVFTDINPAHVRRFIFFVKNHSVDHLRLIQRYGRWVGFAHVEFVRPLMHCAETRFWGHCLGTLHSQLSAFVGVVFDPRKRIALMMLLRRLGFHSAGGRQLVAEYVGQRWDAIIVATVVRHFWRLWFGC